MLKRSFIRKIDLASRTRLCGVGNDSKPCENHPLPFFRCTFACRCCWTVVWRRHVDLRSVFRRSYRGNWFATWDAFSSMECLGQWSATCDLWVIGKNYLLDSDEIGGFVMRFFLFALKSIQSLGKLIISYVWGFLNFKFFICFFIVCVIICFKFLWRIYWLIESVYYISKIYMIAINIMIVFFYRINFYHKTHLKLKLFLKETLVN